MLLHPRSEWAWLWRESRPFVLYHAASLGCVLAAAAIGLAQPLVMKWLIDDVLPNGRWGALAIASGMFLGAAVTRASITSLGSLLTTIGASRMTHRVRTRCVKRVLSFSPASHARYTAGDLLQRLERDVATIGETGSAVFPSIARMIGETSMAIGIMLYLDWRLTGVVGVLVPLFAYARQRCRRILRGGVEAVREANGRQTSLLQEMLGGITQLQLLGAEGRMMRRYVRLSLTTVRHEIGLRKNELAFTFVSMSVVGLGIALIVGYTGVRVILGGLTVGGLVAFYGYVSTVLLPIGTAASLSGQLIRVRVSIGRMIELEQAQDVIQDAPAAEPLPSCPRAVVCCDVSLDYGAGREVLRRVHFRAHAGERVAIVGVSGSGKSSLLKLIPRLHEPGEGTVFIDGRDVRSLTLQSLRGAISFVPQEPVLFQGTLRQNLRHGRAAASAEDIERAAWVACLDEVVARLPAGWDTELGVLGAGLSGGERQRVAIARALLQRRPILILDEATSALDSATETRLLSRLEEWAEDRIVIVVSHRLAPARWADRVVVLSRGEVVEDATMPSCIGPGPATAHCGSTGTLPPYSE